MKKSLVMIGLSLFLAACASTTGSAPATAGARETIDTARDGVRTAREGAYLIHEIKSLFKGY